MTQSLSLKVGWRFLFASFIYTVVIGLLVTLRAQAMLKPNFVAFVGQNWPDFVADQAKAANLFVVIYRFLGAAILTSSILGAVVAWTSYSKGQKWSWYLLLATGLLGWGSALTYHITIGYSSTTAIVVVGLVVFLAGIAVPAKAILRKKSM